MKKLLMAILGFIGMCVGILALPLVAGAVLLACLYWFIEEDCFGDHPWRVRHVRRRV